MPDPTFIVIGAMKGGTTSLHQYLATHPEISMSRVKETNYFLGREEYERGPQWYRSLFDRDAQAIGESSPNYTKRQYWGGIPERISQALPEVKLIYVVRDPVSRLISHYTHRYAEGSESKAFSRAIIANPGYLQTSMYGYQLEAYLEHFSADKILVLDSSSLRNQTDDVLRRIYQFVGVNVDHVADNTGKNFHDSAEKSRESFVKRRIPSYRLQQILNRVLPARLVQRQPFARPTPSVDDLKFITDTLGPDIEKFRKYTAMQFADWPV